MADRDEMARRFEACRPHLEATARRVLGPGDAADDAVQEAWLRLERADADAIDNVEAWLTTVVARICLDTVRARRAHPVADVPDAVADDDPERDAVLADAVGQALGVVVGELRPRERLAFVLHDVFGYSFDDIAAMTGSSAVAARQAASRARRRIAGVHDDPEAPRADRGIVEAFLTASREGDIAGLVAVLAPGVALTADPAALAMGAERYLGAPGADGETLAAGPDAVARAFAGRAQAAEAATIDGAAGAVWMHGGRLRVAFVFTVHDGRVTGIRLVADPAAHAAMTIVPG